MTYLRSAAVGLVTALAFCVLWIVATLIIPLAAMFIQTSAEGSGGIGFVSASSNTVLAVAAVGFVAGAYWDQRRRRRRDGRHG